MKQPDDGVVPILKGKLKEGDTGHLLASRAAAKGYR